MNKTSPYQYLIDGLEADQLPSAARKLSYIFNDMQWSSHRDFLHSFASEAERIKAQYGARMSPDTQQSYHEVALEVRLIWPEFDA